MISTVSVTVGARWAWQSELLEHSWRQVSQAGELIHLRAVNGEAELPPHSSARIVSTTSWLRHPFQHDSYAGYDLPAALLEWTLMEKPDSTVLLLSPDSVLVRPIEDEVLPGAPIGQPGPRLAIDSSHPFGLGAEFASIQRFCAEPQLQVEAVQTPLLIHGADLRSISARWLELTGLLRQRLPAGLREGSVAFAYLIAAAERGLVHDTRTLEVEAGVDDEMSEAPIVRYSAPVLDADGKEIWSQADYQPWQAIGDPSRASSAAGRRLLGTLTELIDSRHRGFGGLLPQRRENVLEGRVGGRLLVFPPGQTQGHSLDAGDRLVWELCDGRRDVSRIVTDLEERDPSNQRTLEQVRDRLMAFEEAGILELR